MGWSSKMQVVEIRDIVEFEKVRTVYEAVYSADAHAQVIVSWTWLRGWLEMIPGSWVVLCVRENEASPYTAFLPLMMQDLRVLGVGLLRCLRIGRHEYCYGGFLCLPGAEDEALMHLAYYVGSRLHWDVLTMTHVRDPRLIMFLNGFPQSRYNAKILETMSSLCVDLPGSWDDYLRDCLGRETRKTLSKRTRALEQNGNICVTQTTVDSMDKDIDALLGLWQARWGPQSQAYLEKRMLSYCFREGCLWLGVIWHDQMPIAAQCGVVDWNKKTFLAYLTGFDREYSSLAPGNVVIGYSIRWAIENGLQVFDFTFGGEAYKLAFGAQRHDAKSVIIARRDPRSAVAIALLREPNILKRSIAAARRLIAARTRLARIVNWLKGKRSKIEQDTHDVPENGR